MVMGYQQNPRGPWANPNQPRPQQQPGMMPGGPSPTQSSVLRDRLSQKVQQQQAAAAAQAAAQQQQMGQQGIVIFSLLCFGFS